MRILSSLLALAYCTAAFAQSPPPSEPTTAPPAATETPAASTTTPSDANPPAAATQTVPPALESPAPKTANAKPQAALEPPANLPLAGYANGSFFLRDPHDWFVLFPKGRLQVDWYNFLNRGDVPAGVVPNSGADPRPKDTIFVRRARVELQGTFIGHFDFHIAGEFTTTPAAGSFGALADAYIIADYLSFLKVQAGQFDIPFTLENRTSDKYLDFIERGPSVRYFAVPQNKDQGAMAWGWLPKNVAYYSVGVFNADGQNFKNQDNWGAFIGRAFIAPVAWLPAADKYKWLKDIEVGGSFWWQHQGNLGGAIAGSSGATQNDLSGMSTTGGFGFFSSNYNVATDGAGNAIRAHLVPSGETVKWALEARVPIWKFGLQAELIHVSEDLLSYYDSVNVPNAMTGKWSGGAFSRAAPKAGGNLDGYGGYIEVFGWILGDVNFIETPGLEPMPHIKKFAPAKEPLWGLRVLARYEQVTFNITGLPGIVDPVSGTTSGDVAVGLYKLHQFGLGLDAWGTKHVRLSVNYFMNYIDGDAPLVKKNFFYQRAEHELLFRAGINL
ncbi:MAG: hypothetical protein JWM53_2631 [bacterium]|nr:hypothetical protein [bacterium]